MFSDETVKKSRSKVLKKVLIAVKKVRLACDSECRVYL